MARSGLSSQVVLLVATATLLLQVTGADRINKEGKGNISRIIGGQATTANKFPHQVYITSLKAGSNDSYLGCGGSIISKTWVMSAAHCFTKQVGNTGFELGVSRIHIWAGITNLEESNNKNVQKNIIEDYDFDDHLFIHEDYRNTASHNNDISLIKLKKQLSYNSKVQPIDLANTGDFKAGNKVTVSGWGRTSTGDGATDILLYASGLKLISRKECTKMWGTRRITDKMICHKTDRKYLCTGDSGGPVITNRGNSNRPHYVQIGIISWGWPSCGNPRAPGVFVDVAKFRKWIIQTMSGCYDSAGASVCRGFARFCEDREHVLWFTQWCKKTCNKCG